MDRQFPTPVILDVDPGHDDAIALMLACGAPELDVLAVTTVAGNAPLEKTTRNALRVLSLIGHTDIPVAAGARGPLVRALRTAEHIHGASGLDGPEIPDPSRSPDPRGALRLLSDTLESSPRPVTLIPTGPLTNIATFLRERPDLEEKIERIVLMGGSIGPGNVTPAAEFNIYVDPEAAHEVFESGLDVTMAGLDVTHHAGVGPEEVSRLETLGRAGETAADLISFYASAYERLYGYKAPPIHDAVAVAHVIDPSILELRPMRVDIERESSLTRGTTVCDLHGVTGKPSNASVAISMDRERFFEVLYRSLERL